MEHKPTEQYIYSSDGEPVAVILSVEAYEALTEDRVTFPHEVISLELAGCTLVKAWRKHLKLTQSQVAKEMGVTQSTYQGIESSGTAKRGTLQRVAEALSDLSDYELEVEHLTG